MAAAPTNCVVSDEWIGRIVVVSAAGDVDMLGAPQLEEAIKSAFDQNPTGLVVDFTNVDFLASAGMGVDLCVVADGPATSRPLKLVGIADIVRVYATRDEAVSALNA